MSDSRGLCGLQRTRLLCPPLSPEVCSNSCPLSWSCCLTISSSATPFSFCLPSSPASRSFPTSRFFASGGQSLGASASATVLPKNNQSSFPLGWTVLISLQSKRLARVFSSTIIRKHQSFRAQPFYGPALTSVHDHWRNTKVRYFRSDFTEEEAEAQEVKIAPLQHREQGAGTRS